MKNKFSSIIAGIFALVFLISLASAVTISNIPSDLSRDGGSFEIGVSTTNLNDSISVSIDNPYSDIDFTINDTDFTLNNESKEITITYNTDDFDFEFREDYSVTLNAEGTNSTDKSVELDFETNSDICEADNVGNDLNIEIDDISIMNGYGDDEEWFPLDEIEVEVIIENDGNEDIDDIELEWGIYDSSNNEWIVELDDIEEFDLRDGDEETFIISFTLDEGDLDVDLDELEDGSYDFYVRATGEIADGPNEDDNTCESDRETVEIIIERDFVTLHDLEIPESVQCDAPLQISGEVWNIGEDEQEDVVVRIQNNDLGINEVIDIGDIDEFDSEPFSANFELPEDLTAGTYFLHFEVLDEDGDLFEADHDDQKPSFSQSIVVTGDCTPSEASVSAVLEEGGEAGEELTVRTTIENTGSKTSTYLLNSEGYSEWANSARFEQSTVTINAGESKEVLVTLDVKDDVEGEKLFDIEILSDGELIATQPVSVNIEPKSGLSITGFAINSDNWHLWGIGLLNLILVIAIIIIAVRIMRKK